MGEYERFQAAGRAEIAAMAGDHGLTASTRSWMERANGHRYSYHFEWAGRPIIQYPQDIVAMQEIIWRVRPDLIIETGIAHGGSLIFSAAMLAMIDYCDAVESRTMLDPNKPSRTVVGVDIDIRSHNRAAIEAHPLSNRISLIQGSSVAPEVVDRIRALAAEKTRVLVCLDSNHTHDHVAAELEAYADLASIGSYCVVFDTVIEDFPPGTSVDRPWGPGNNPKTAVREYLKKHPEFEIDREIESKLLITVAPDGFLKRVA